MRADLDGPLAKKPARAGGSDSLNRSACAHVGYPLKKPACGGVHYPLKKPACAGFFPIAARPCSGERADMRGQATFMPGSLVFVDQTARSVAIHHRLGDHERGFGSRLVLCFDRLDDILDRGANHRTRAGVALTVLLGLARTLLRGFDVGQGKTPVKGVGKRLEIMTLNGHRVNSRDDKASAPRPVAGCCGSAGRRDAVAPKRPLHRGLRRSHQAPSSQAVSA